MVIIQDLNLNSTGVFGFKMTLALTLSEFKVEVRYKCDNWIAV